MSGISTHVLDTANGRTANGVAVALERWELDAWLPCAVARTDGDGRCKELLVAAGVVAGRYRLTFATGEYFGAGQTFFPEVAVTFEVERDGGSYHVPLLVSGFGYSTYRGS